MKRVNGKEALRKLQGLLGSLKIEPCGETVTGEVAFMSNISSALVKTDEGIYMIGVNKKPNADPGLRDEPYLHYFVDALVALNELTFDEGEAALTTLARQRTARIRADNLVNLKIQAKEHGYTLVKAEG